MKARIWLLFATLVAVLVAPETAQAVWVHNLDCNTACHKPTAQINSLNNTVCLSCHVDAKLGTTVMQKDGSTSSPISTVFAAGDASNALGTFPGGLTPVAQTSHFWAAPKDVVPAAGAKAPANRFFYGRYGISSGKVTCSRCHDPHGDKTTNPKLLKLGAGTESAMCLDCHSPWNKGSVDRGLLSHPIVADYAAVATANPSKYNNPMLTTGNLQLVNGGVSCLSCHGMHWADSNSTTTDGKGNQATVNATGGDGHTLRADGPLRTGATEADTAQLRSNLCQACHKYARHGIGRTHPIGCLECHSGHSYDKNNPTLPNYYVLRASNGTVYRPKTSSVGSVSLNYKTLTTEWANAGGTGYCQQCHNLTFPHNGLNGGGKAACASCHAHGGTTGSFAANCTGCHGYPPSQNVAGGTPNSGFAYVAGSRDYRNVVNYKDESLTAHVRHAASSQYKISCDRCHAGVFNNNQHNNNNFQDVYFDTFSTNGGLIPAYDPAGNAGDGQCSNIYCHSNGGARTGDATRTTTAATIPKWEAGDIANCTSCHGNSSATMTGKNSASHNKHLNKGYACNVCHEGTATSSTTLVAAAVGGIHVNGTREVSFATAYNLGAATLGGGAYGSIGGTCSTYCHSNGKGTKSTPDWDTASTGACGTCHGVASGTVIASGTHTAHINDSDFEIGRNLGCTDCHSNTVSNNTTISNQANHVNGALTLGIALDANKTTCSNISCHSNGNYDGTLAYKASGTDFVWGGAALAGCDDCHGDGAGKAYPTYANGGSGTTNANSHGAHMVGGGAACGDCHSETSTAGTTINGTAPTKHVNKAIDVKGAKINGGIAGSFNSTTKTCSSVSCHGGNSPVWGATLTCGSCHLRSAGDADDFTYNNGTLAMLDTEEWLYSGHGKASGTYDMTGRSAAAFAGTDPCLYCHDNSISHGATNYFRLRQNGKPDLNGACLGCHATGSAGVDPDGAGTGYALKNSAVKIDKYHGGAKHDAATGRDAGRWCWDCHDPHGDTDTAGLRIQMLQRRLAVNPDDNGKPASLTGTDIIFTDRTVGAGAGGFARNAAPYGEGVCNACHTQTNQYRTNLGANGHPTSRCTSCHTHSGGTAYDATAFKATCYGCHGSSSNGQYWPYGSGGAILTANDQAGRHQKHVEVLASRLYSQSVAQLLADASTDTKQKAICSYCHATPGNDADHGLAASLPADKAFRPIWNVTAAASGTFTAGNCSNIACHLNKATGTGTYGWYDAGTSACIMCHRDITSGAAGTTGESHQSHLSANSELSTYKVAMACSTCHNSATNWSTNTPPSSNHINGTFNIGGTVSLTYSGTFPTVFGSCSTNRCHNDGKNNAPKVTATWGTAIASCTNCHDWNPATEAHKAHFDAALVNPKIVNSMGCNCHNDPTVSTHANGTVNVIAGMNYTGDTSVTVANNFGSCSTTTCHNNGSGTAVPTPLWNRTPSSADTCSLCHANLPATGSHGKHIAKADYVPASYGQTGNETTATQYVFRCGECHGATLSNHINGTRNVTVTNWNSTAKTCGQNNCHQNGAGAAPAVTVTWGATPAGDPCAICHGNAPTTNAHKAHEVGFHYNAIYTGTTGLLPVGTPGDATTDQLRGHGGNLTADGTPTSTVLSCQICHNETVTVTYNARNSVCDVCHNAAANPTLADKNSGNAAIEIADKTKHVNSTKNVRFINQKLRSKGQVRDSLSDVPEIGNNWARVNGYKASDGSSYDQTVNTLYNSATFNSTDKSCTVACHLWEAGRVDKVAPKWNQGAIMCIDCHTRLPK